MNGYVSIRLAAEVAGVDRRLMRRRLQMLNEEFGGILFRFSDAPNAKLWTTPAALREHMPERFAEVTSLDLLELRASNQELAARVARLEKKLSRSESK